jgi:hypothetical protein
LAAAGLAEGASPAPFRVLYSNDTTNIESSPSPGYRSKDPFSLDRLRVSVNEAAGVDAHMLQPGNGWVPWWKSRIYPADSHYRWFQESTGLSPGSIGELMMRGGDLVGPFIEHCRSRGVAPFISIRVNDYHGIEMLELLQKRIDCRSRNEEGPAIDHHGAAWLSRVQLEHPEYRLRPDPDEYVKLSDAEKLTYAKQMRRRIKLRTARVWNWAIPEVPAYKLSLIRELCETYDFAGLELDFMRWSAFFRLEETSQSQRVAIMLGFIKGVREALDRTARQGERRWLCVRVPLRLSGHSALGVDLPQWVEAGVDMVNLSCHYTTEQQSDLPRIHRLIPNTPLYLEMTFVNERSPKRGSDSLSDRGENSDVFRKMTAEQFYTTAHLVYARGGAGVSLFNFVYYRSLTGKKAEPPFAVLPHLGDPEWLAGQAQHYFLSKSTNPPSKPSQFERNRMVSSEKERLFAIDAAPPRGGWTSDGRLRLQSRAALGTRQFTVRFNGHELVPNADVSEPYPSPYRDGLGDSETLRAWTVPKNLMRDGENEIGVRLVDGETPPGQSRPAAPGKPVEVVFIDLSIR